MDSRRDQQATVIPAVVDMLTTVVAPVTEAVIAERGESPITDIRPVYCKSERPLFGFSTISPRWNST
eukprot:gene17868-biopygen5160